MKLGVSFLLAYCAFQNYVVLDSNETQDLKDTVDDQFQNYVVLDSNETKSDITVSLFSFQNYVVLDSNETNC